MALISFVAALYHGFGQDGASHVGVRDAAVVSSTAFHGRDVSALFAPNSPPSTVAAVEAISGVLVEGLFIPMLAQRVFGR